MSSNANSSRTLRKAAVFQQAGQPYACEHGDACADGVMAGVAEAAAGEHLSGQTCDTGPLGLAGTPAVGAKPAYRLCLVCRVSPTL